MRRDTEVSVPVMMPKLGLTMKHGKVSKWFKAEGDVVRKGENIFEVETDKITNTVESPSDGVLFQIVTPAGATVDVLAVVGLIAAPGETPERLDVGRAEPVPPREADQATPAGSGPQRQAAPTREILASPAARRVARELGVNLTTVQGTGPGGRIQETDVRARHEAALRRPRCTPLAAVLAEQAGLDLSGVAGTGEGGRITRADVERALAPPTDEPRAEAGPAGGGGVTALPLSGMRRAIADNMSASLRNTAQLTLMTEADITRSLSFLAAVREEHKRDDSFRVSLNDVLILAVSRALKRFPMMNSTQSGDDILVHDNVNIGVAVALDEGLIVPVITDAHGLGLTAIARKSRELAAKARGGSLDPEDVFGGTFTITNMNRSVVDFFTPILKPAETGILGVGRTVEKPVARDGQVVVRPMVGLSLTFDHRIVDGALAGEFLGLVSRYLERPSLMLL